MRNSFDQHFAKKYGTASILPTVSNSTIHYSPKEGRNEETYRKPQAPVDEEGCVNGCKVDIISWSLFIRLVDFWNLLPFSATVKLDSQNCLSVAWLFVCFSMFSKITTKPYDVTLHILLPDHYRKVLKYPSSPKYKLWKLFMWWSWTQCDEHITIGESLKFPILEQQWKTWKP